MQAWQLSIFVIHMFSDTCFQLQKTEEAEHLRDQKKHFQQLRQADEQDLIKNTQPFECSICFSDINADEGVMLRECLHVFCRFVQCANQEFCVNIQHALPKPMAILVGCRVVLVWAWCHQYATRIFWGFKAKLY